MDGCNTREKRAAEIVFSDNLAVTLKSLTLYRDYLSKNLETPCIMTGRDDPPWEQEYVPGYHDAGEGDAPKEETALCADIYELKRFEDLMDEVTGIMVKVKRIRDNHRFILKLVSLKAVDETSKNGMLLDDYSAWFVNQ